MGGILVSRTPTPLRPQGRRDEVGSVLIIVLWLVLGLAAVALLFGHGSMVGYRAAANTAACLSAQQTIAGAQRYLAYALANVETPGTLPSASDCAVEDVAMGDCRFWVIGRDPDRTNRTEPVFGLVDEAAKLSLNLDRPDAREMLEALPGMTPQLAAAIIDWRDADDTVTPDGAEAETYLRLSPAYNCKNGRFETIEELRLVAGATRDLVYGPDANWNGVIEPWEQGRATPGSRVGQTLGAELGLLEYVTVYSREPNRDAQGRRRTDINGEREAVIRALGTALGSSGRAMQVTQAAGLGSRPFGSVLEFCARGRLSRDEAAQVLDAFTVGSGEYREGLINVNTAPAAVLACIPGVGTEGAAKLVAYRVANPDSLESLAWVMDSQALDASSLTRAGSHLTTRAFQVSADVVAVGPHGRGFARQFLVFDTSGSEPVLVFRQDRSAFGWPLGQKLRAELDVEPPPRTVSP